MPTPNPFAQPSPLPFQAPPFDRIHDRHYRDALDEGIAREADHIRTIAESAEPPTFTNTYEALERAGTMLRRVSQVFHEIADSTSTPELRRIDAEYAPRLAAHRDTIHLNPRLFERLQTVFTARETLDLSPEARRLVERRFHEFVRAGAALGEADQQRLRAINEEHARLTTEFRDRLLDATNAAAVAVGDRALLAGLTDQEIAAAASAARERDLDGQYLLTLQNTTQQPILESLADRDVRRRVFEASIGRGRGGAHDTTALAARLAQIRAERAAILGFPTFAALEIEDQVARTTENALELLTRLVPPAVARAKQEAARMQQIIDAAGGGFRLEAYDWPYYAEQVRRTDHALDVNDVRPYLELDRVLHDGVFFAASRLYGLTFQPRRDLPVYHPDVRVYDVFEEDGSPLALFYFDPFSRPGKSGGAWSHSFVEQSRLLDTHPVVVNVLNLTRPAPGDPVLVTFDEVRTLFHEFGHAVHAMFSDVSYPTLAGTSVPRDWVEFPSQINEHWALEPSVLERYARHHRTGAPMPAALVERIKGLQTFNQGYRTTEYLGAALLDQVWHTLPADAPLQEVETFEAAALGRFGLHERAVPPRYSTPYFLHIWGRGYAAAYYAYIWAEVLDHDAFRWFEAHGGLTRANGQRFRDLVLSRGDTEEGDLMFRRLVGRDPDIAPLLAARGLH